MGRWMLGLKPLLEWTRGPRGRHCTSVRVGRSLRWETACWLTGGKHHGNRSRWFSCISLLRQKKKKNHQKASYPRVSSSQWQCHSWWKSTHVLEQNRKDLSAVWWDARLSGHPEVLLCWLLPHLTTLSEQRRPVRLAPGNPGLTPGTFIERLSSFVLEEKLLKSVPVSERD